MASKIANILNTGGVEVPEQFNCPICFNLPEEKIFQCKNGHIICQACKLNLVVCPQCRVDFKVDGSFIRNIVLESFLETIPVQCSYYNEGCRERIMKKDLKLHCRKCKFNPVKLQICQRLGHTCNCTFSSGDLQQLADHIQDGIHAKQVWLRKETPTLLRLKNFSASVEEYIKFDPNEVNEYSPEGVWKPMFVNLYDGATFLLVARYLKAEKALTWTCCSLQAETEPKRFYEMELTLHSNSKKMPDLRLSAVCIPVFDTEEVWNSAPVHVPVTVIQKHYLDVSSDVLNLGIWIRKARKPLDYGSFVDLRFCNPVVLQKKQTVGLLGNVHRDLTFCERVAIGVAAFWMLLLIGIAYHIWKHFI